MESTPKKKETNSKLLSNRHIVWMSEIKCCVCDVMAWLKFSIKISIWTEQFKCQCDIQTLQLNERKNYQRNCFESKTFVPRNVSATPGGNMWTYLHSQWDFISLQKWHLNSLSHFWCLYIVFILVRALPWSLSWWSSSHLFFHVITE